MARRKRLCRGRVILAASCLLMPGQVLGRIAAGAVAPDTGSALAAGVLAAG